MMQADMQQQLSPAHYTEAKAPNEWRADFFDFSDIVSLLGACIFPCYTNAVARNRYDGSNVVFNALCVPSCVMRSVIRNGYQIEGNCLCDWFLGGMLAGLSAQQLLKEAELRGPKTPAGTPVGQFRKGLGECDCGGDCFKAFICPNCAAASVRSDYDESHCLFNCMFVQPCMTRNIVREGYHIDGDCCSDILISMFCIGCSIHQLQQEVKFRNIRKYAQSAPMMMMGGQPVMMMAPGSQPMMMMQGQGQPVMMMQGQGQPMMVQGQGQPMMMQGQGQPVMMQQAQPMK